MNASAHIRQRRFSSAASIVLLALCCVPVARVHAQGSSLRSETFTLRPGAEVRVENPRGATRVETWDSTNVRVLAEKKSGKEDVPIEPSELVMMGAGNTLIIEARHANLPGRLDLTLYIPKQTQQIGRAHV